MIRDLTKDLMLAELSLIPSDMQTHFTADHHFGHANIIGLSARPFASVEEMDARLIENWESPLAQVWNVCIMNPDLPSLKDFRGKGGIDLSYGENEMQERAIKFRATGPGENVSLSNAVWISCKEKIQRTMLLAMLFHDKIQDPEHEDR
jgi:hypothetical protein